MNICRWETLRDEGRLKGTSARNGDEDGEVGLTASFMAKNLDLTERVDVDDEREELLLIVGKIFASRGVWMNPEMQEALVRQRDKVGYLIDKVR